VTQRSDIVDPQQNEVEPLWTRPAFSAAEFEGRTGKAVIAELVDIASATWEGDG
jgi:hypothetical protein